MCDHRFASGATCSSTQSAIASAALPRLRRMLEEERTMPRDRPDVVDLPVRVRFLAVLAEVRARAPDRRRARRPARRPARRTRRGRTTGIVRASTGRASSPSANDSRRSTTSLVGRDEPSQAASAPGSTGIQRRLLQAEIVPALERVDHERPRGCPRDDEPVRHVSAAGGDVPGKQKPSPATITLPFAIELLEDPRRCLRPGRLRPSARAAARLAAQVGSGRTRRARSSASTSCSVSPVFTRRSHDTYSNAAHDARAAL